MKSRLGPVQIALFLASAVACNSLLEITQLHGSSAPEDAGDARMPVVSQDATDPAVLREAGAASLDADDSTFSGAPPGAGAAPDAARESGGEEGAGCFARPSGLVSWWRAEGNADDSAGLNNGTLTNVTFVPGVVGQAFHFPGDPAGGGEVVAGAARLPTGGDDRTVEMWVRLDATYEATDPVFVQGEFFGYGGWGTSNGVYNLLVFAGGAASLPNDSLGFSQWGQFLRSSVLTERVWHHLAATWASGTITIYVDGSFTVSDRTSFALATSDGGTVCMGGLPSSVLPNTAWLTGALDEVSVYTRALSPAEIQGIFLAGSHGKCP